MCSRLCILLAVVALPVGGASNAALDRATLKGVTAVSVAIDPIPPEIEREGATTDGLRTRLEEQLRNGGVKIDPASTAFVALRLTSVRAARGPFAIAATVGLYQPVTLVRDKNVKTSTQTWEVGTVVLADSKQVYRACMDSVDELASQFVTAYKSVNPNAAGAVPQPSPARAAAR